MITSHKLLCVLIVMVVWLLPTSFPNKSLSAQSASIPGAEERERGIDLYRKARFIEAGQVLKKAVDKNKADEQSWYYLGLALLQNPKEIKNASKAFETSIKLRPDFAAAHAGLSYAFVARGKFPEALREAQATIRIDPGIANAHYIIGVVQLNAGAIEEALTAARTALRLNPNLAAAYLLQSEALMETYSKQVVESRGTTTQTDTPPTPEEVAERRQRRAEALAPLKEAAESLETYLKLNSSAPSAALWQEQLTTLRVFTNLNTNPTNSGTIWFGDEVTTKIRVLSKPEPSYTEQARLAGLTGTVILRAVFAVDGRVRHILVIKSLPNGLTEQAVEAAKRIKFTPATSNGRPVSMFVQLEYNFNLY